MYTSGFNSPWCYFLNAHHVELDIGSKILGRIVFVQNDYIGKMRSLFLFLILVQMKRRCLGGKGTTRTKVFNQHQAITVVRKKQVSENEKKTPKRRRKMRPREPAQHMHFGFAKCKTKVPMSR